ncbi:hypothetical protein KDJ56_17400 [Brevibacillus composti]|uniref:Uncharacterized protein n=1 Tax=Brevibacillus composti TaxID=2796470 RepID=A0A7T5EJA6_9BACL|nr:hypothetical protein [Brevibacillus composti]QQE73656.1 hypothetical protein JD108_17455 [Brevibacillus composti]QUO40738.1 hypothetical protein KDJ56_17400 [Brevibacillus composti]
MKFKMFKKVTGISALGLALGSVMTFGFSVVSADSKYIEKDGFLINSETQAPATEYVTIEKGSPAAKQKKITLVNGIDKSVVAEITFDEYIERQEYYEGLLTEKTIKAKEALIKAGKWEEFKEKHQKRYRLGSEKEK